MAFGNDHEEDCPNCPPSHSRQHDEHELTPSDMADNGMPCASSAADCGILDEYNYDGRTVQLKVKDAPIDLPVAVQSFAVLVPNAEPVGQTYTRQIQRHPPGPPQRLNKLYCVYLK